VVFRTKGAFWRSMSLLDQFPLSLSLNWPVILLFASSFPYPFPCLLLNLLLHLFHSGMPTSSILYPAPHGDTPPLSFLLLTYRGPPLKIFFLGALFPSLETPCHCKAPHGMPWGPVLAGSPFQFVAKGRAIFP